MRRIAALYSSRWSNSQARWRPRSRRATPAASRAATSSCALAATPFPTAAESARRGTGSGTRARAGGCGSARGRPPSSFPLATVAENRCRPLAFNLTMCDYSVTIRQRHRRCPNFTSPPTSAPRGWIKKAMFCPLTTPPQCLLVAPIQPGDLGQLRLRYGQDSPPARPPSPWQTCLVLRTPTAIAPLPSLCTCGHSLQRASAPSPPRCGVKIDFIGENGRNPSENRVSRSSLPPLRREVHRKEADSRPCVHLAEKPEHVPSKVN